MNTINKDQVDDYVNRMIEAQELNKKIQDKAAKITELTRQRGSIRAEANTLQERLNTANRDMQMKKLSHDDFLQLKRDMTEKTEELAGLTHSLAEKNEAVAVLKNHLTQANKASSILRQRLAGDMVGQLADEVLELAGAPLSSLISVLVVSRGLNKGYTITEQTAWRQKLYMAIGEAICEPVAWRHNETVIEIPDLIQAKQQVETFINQSISAAA